MVVTDEDLRRTVTHVTDHIVQLSELVAKMTHCFRVHVPLLKLVGYLDQLIHHRIVHVLELRMGQRHVNMLLLLVFLLLLIQSVTHLILETFHDILFLFHVLIDLFNLLHICWLKILVNSCIFILKLWFF